MDSVTIGSLLVYIKAPSPALATAFPSSFAPGKKKKKAEALEILEIGGEPVNQQGWAGKALFQLTGREKMCDPLVPVRPCFLNLRAGKSIGGYPHIWVCALDFATCLHSALTTTLYKVGIASLIL